MSYSNPKKLALGTALLITLFFSITYAVSAILLDGFSMLLLIILNPALFIFSYIVLEHTISRFVYEKIKIIYKTIHNFKVSRETGDKERIDESLEDVNKTVVEWGEKQKEEIDHLKELAVYRR